MNRRTFLRGTGAMLSLPFLECLAPARVLAGKQSAPRRLAVITQELGVLHDTFFPAGASARGYKMPEVLAELEPIRQHMTVFSHISHSLTGGHHAAGGVLNGVKPELAAQSPFGATSLDQRMAEIIGPQTRFGSLRCWGMNGLSSSYSRSGSQLPASAAVPSEFYKRLFQQGTKEEMQKAQMLLAEGQSILDLVSDDAKRFQVGLGRQDRVKLEEYFESVRSVENQLIGQGRWLDVPKPQCPDAALAKRIATGGADDLGHKETLSVWVDLMHLALTTDSSRVMATTIPITKGIWDLPGITKDAHFLSHHGMEKWKMDQFQTIERHILREFRRLVEKLKSDRQPDGTSLLDSTLLLYASGLSNGATHSNDNLPVILAGGRGEHGWHLNVDRAQPLNSLYLSMLQWMDPAQTEFNGVNKALRGVKLA